MSDAEVGCVEQQYKRHHGKIIEREENIEEF
jgi:hypothetical protein